MSETARQRQIRQIREQQAAAFHADPWPFGGDPFEGFVPEVKTVKRLTGLIVVVWTLSVLASLALTSAVIWAIYRLVTHYA